MHFARIDYLRWAARRLDAEPARWNLGGSGMEPPAAADLGFGPGAGGAADSFDVTTPHPFGHPALRAAVARFSGVGPERVLLAQGGTSLANFLVAAAILRPGDLALCERPAYEPLPRVLEALGARVLWIERRPEREFAPDLDDVRRGFAVGARLLALTDLHNPSAALLDRDLLREIGAIARRHDAWALVDEVYLLAVFDREPADLPSAAALGEERLIATASLTKAFGLGALRAGWAIAPPDVVARAQEIFQYLGVEPATIADEAAVRAFERIGALRARSSARRAANWPLVRDFLATRGLAFAEPAGGFMVWVRLPAGLDGDALEALLRERHETQVTPGSFFGARDHVRIGFGGPTGAVREGLRRLGLALDEALGRGGGPGGAQPEEAPPRDRL